MLVAGEILQPSRQKRRGIFVEQGGSGVNLNISCPSRLFPLGTVRRNRDHVGSLRPSGILIKPVNHFIGRLEGSQVLIVRRPYHRREIFRPDRDIAGHSHVPESVVSKMRRIPLRFPRGKKDILLMVSRGVAP